MTNTPAFIGRYQVLERLGEGGMGTLYLSRDPAIERLVAIKLLRRGFDSEEARQRFAREARAAGRLHHPHVVTIFDVGEHDGNPFIAMEFLAGETLAQLIRQRARLALPRKLALIEELCDGLAYAHRAGLVHRDVKPANVMVDAQGVLKILDFGIVRTEESGMTNAGEIVGTLNYMSPEQITGDSVDHRSDIFAVGVVAYELLSYTQAFTGTIKDGLLDRIAKSAVAPLATVSPGLDSEVIRIVEKAMAQDPGRRYQDLARMRNDVTAVRQRLEREALAAETSMADETAVLVLPPRGGAGPDGDPPTTAVATALVPELVEAQRALSTGKYQQALLLASRSAAIEPDNVEATAIIERAKSGLLEAGRAKASGDTGTIALPSNKPVEAAPATSPPPSAMPPGGGTIPAATPLAAPASDTSAAEQENVRSRRRTVPPIAMAAALAGLSMAGAAGWYLSRSSSAVTTPTPNGSRLATATPTSASPPTSASREPAPPPAPLPSAPLSAEPSLVRSAEPATGAISPGPADALPKADVALDAVRQRARRELARGATERGLSIVASGLARYPGDRELERLLTDTLAASRDRARVAQQGAEAAGAAESAAAAYASGLERARSAARAYSAGHAAVAVHEFQAAWEAFERAASEAHASRSRQAGRAAAASATPPVSTRMPAEITGAPVLPASTPEPTPASPGSVPAVTPPAPAPSRPATAAPAPEAPPLASGSSTPARGGDEARNDEAAIRQTLRAYESAWESLDVGALERVQQLSSAERSRVEQSMASARQYSMHVSVEDIAMTEDRRRAVVSSQIEREFTPKVGRTTRHTVRSRLTLEKRDGRWLIVGVQ